MARLRLAPELWDLLGRSPAYAEAIRKASTNGCGTVVASLLAELTLAGRHKRLPCLIRAWALADARDDDPGCVSGSPAYIAPEVYRLALSESDALRRARAEERQALDELARFLP